MSGTASSGVVLVSDEPISDPSSTFPDPLSSVDYDGASIWFGVSSTELPSADTSLGHYNANGVSILFGSPISVRIQGGQSVDIWASPWFAGPGWSNPNSWASPTITDTFFMTLSDGSGSASDSDTVTLSPSVLYGANLVHFQDTFYQPGTYTVTETSNFGSGAYPIVTVTVSGAPVFLSDNGTTPDNTNKFWVNGQWEQNQPVNGSEVALPTSAPGPGDSVYLGGYLVGGTILETFSSGTVSLTGSVGPVTIGQGSCTLTGQAQLQSLEIDQSSATVGGTLTITGAVDGTGTVDIGAGATLEVTGTLSDTMSDNFVGAGLLKLDSALEASDTLKVADGGTLDISDGFGRADTIDFAAAGTLEIEAKGSPLASTGASALLVGEAGVGVASATIHVETIENFTSEDVIEFPESPNAGLTLFWDDSTTPGLTTVNVYESNSEEYSFQFKGDFSNLEPIVAPVSSAAGSSFGTLVQTDPSPVGPLDPTDGNSIKWSYIHGNEGLEFEPYWTPNKGGGVTIGYGVDLGTGPLRTPSAFAAALAGIEDASSDTNLRLLQGALGLTSKTPVTPKQWLISNGAPPTPNSDGNLQSVSMSLTKAQVYALTYASENALFTQMTTFYGKETPLTPFNNLPDGVQTGVMDLYYNLPSAVLSTGLLSAAASFDSAASASEQQTALNLIYQILTHYNINSDVNARASKDASQLIAHYITGPPPPPSSENPTSSTSNASTYNFDTTAGVQYAVAPPGTSAAGPATAVMPAITSALGAQAVTGSPAGQYDYTLTESATSPYIASLMAPSGGATSFDVRYELGTTWSAPQAILPLGTLELPAGVHALDITPLSGSGNPATLDPNFELVFYVSFASSGTFSGTVAGPSIACFVTGTRVRADRGEVAVEELCVGDRIPTVRAGRSLPVVWIGHRQVRPTQYPYPEDAYPVRVATNAFAEHVPYRDLWLSPEHCVFLHGVLVPIRVLINGTSIVQIPCDEVTYWHVELESHDLMLCEGAWAESYLDMGNRAAFTGTDHPQAPDFSRESWEARACQQQERGGPIIAAIRAVIDARAQARKAV